MNFTTRIVSSLLFLLVIFPFPVNAVTYSLEDVASHNNPTDCWMVFEDSVYNITTYLRSHDRYLDIESWCGKDMTEDFKTKAGLDRDHKTSSYSLLEQYKIGDLSSVQPTIIAEATTEEEHIDEYSVEIEGDQMKLLTITQIADLWEIDAQELLEAVIEEFSLTGSYTIESKLEVLRTEFKFSPAQIKDIAQALKDGTLVTAKETVATSHNPYNLGPILIVSLLFYWVWYFLTKKNLVSRIFQLSVFNFFWNSILLLSLIPAVGFGFFMVIRYSIPSLYSINFDFLFWHVEGSIIMGSIALSHFLTRLNAYFAQIRISFRKKES